MGARSREGDGSEPVRISREDGTNSDADGDDAESEREASQSGEAVPMPRAGERAFLGPGYAALHQRVLHAHVGRTAGEPQRLRAPDKRTLGGHLGRIPQCAKSQLTRETQSGRGQKGGRRVRRVEAAGATPDPFAGSVPDPIYEPQLNHCRGRLTCGDSAAVHS